MAQNHIGLRFKVDIIARAAAILFFINPLVKLVITFVLARLSLSLLADALTAVVVYFPLLIACILAPKKFIKQDFIGFLIFIILFFVLTLLMHPEYEYWYFREDYGVWPYVLQPLNAMYWFLFVRLYRDPDTLKKDFKNAGMLMFLYFAYQLMNMSRRGYWYGVSGMNETEFSYSISFGYHVLFFTLVFLHDAIHERELRDIVLAAAGLLLVIAYGSRGASMCIAVYFILLAMTAITHKKQTPKMLVVYFGIAILMGLLYIFYIPILAVLSAVLDRMNISSRLIEKLLNGTITSDSGRNAIWAAAVQMIKDNPLGYGAMGSQHVIGNLIYVGYPHSIILEILVDFGVFFGGILIAVLAWQSCSMLFGKKTYGWDKMFLPVFSTACSLFISLTYWSNRAFWVCVGLVINAYFTRKRMRKKHPLKREEESDFGEFPNK